MSISLYNCILLPQLSISEISVLRAQFMPSKLFSTMTIAGPMFTLSSWHLMDRMSLGVLNFTATYSNLMSEDEDQKVFGSPSMAIMGWCLEVSGCPGFGES